MRLKLILVLFLVISLLLVSACGQVALLEPLLLEGTATNFEAPLTSHSTEGRLGSCRGCHIIPDVSLGDISSLEGSALFPEGQTTHEGLAEFTCTFCHAPAWIPIKNSGLPRLYVDTIDEDDCRGCHGVDDPGENPH